MRPYETVSTLCQRFAEIKSYRHNIEIHSYYIVRRYKLKPIFAVKKSWNMDHVDVNLIRQLVSVEKYTYTQVSDYLKTQNVP